ncbi:MAG: hypothetical protein KGD73_00730 [Candidatus Lokiarchaeota archaeon]|nr:hypothetical protein [Candidatus Lokiarchaeota archaeon]
MLEKKIDEEDQDLIYECVLKKTKTGITFPKDLRDLLFEEDQDTFFRLSITTKQDKIILEVISEEEATDLSEKLKAAKPKTERLPKEGKKMKSATARSPNWGEYFIYDFKNQDKVKPILESAFYKFGEKPINIEDAMGRIKYVLVSFLSSTKTENSKLYYTVERFLIDIIKQYEQINLLDWIFEMIIPRIESKFLYELALLDLVEISIIMQRYEKAELYIFYVLKNIDDYPKSEMYNIMNSFKQLVKNLKYVERSDKIDILLKEKLMEYGEGVDDTDYKIQIVEFLEDLQYIELAYKLAKKVQLGLPQDSMRLESVRKLVRRLHAAPISENKAQSSIDFDELDEEDDSV